MVHLTTAASPCPEILLKGAAEEYQPGWAMREGKYFYFGKAQPFPLCRALQSTGPRCPLPEQRWGRTGQRCLLSAGKAVQLFLPLLGNQLELFHVMAFAPAKSAWENRQEAHAEMCPAFPVTEPTCHCPWAGTGGPWHTWGWG